MPAVTQAREADKSFLGGMRNDPELIRDDSEAQAQEHITKRV
jgi:hypothetical protein